MQIKTITIVAVLAVGVGACSTREESSSNKTVERDADIDVADGDWKTQVQSRADAVAAADPTRYKAVSELAPIKTRKGTPRFVGEAVRDPAAASVLLQRLADGVDDAELRAALVEALPRTGGEYGAALVQMLPDESDADVRVVMVATLQRADATSAHTGLVLALTDEDPAVRAEAARVASMRVDGAALAGELSAALTDETPQVRAAAARTMGVLQLADARDTLVAGLDDGDADVRLQSLRAVRRIDPTFAARLTKLAALQADTDSRVANVAATIAAAQ